MFKKGLILLTITCLCFTVVGCSTTTTTPSPEPSVTPSVAPTPTPEPEPTPVVQETTAHTIGNIKFLAPSNWKNEKTSKTQIQLSSDEASTISLLIVTKPLKATKISEQNKLSFLNITSKAIPDFKETGRKDVTILGKTGFNYTGTASKNGTIGNVSATVFLDGNYMHGLIFATKNSTPATEAEIQKIIDSIVLNK